MFQTDEEFHLIRLQKKISKKKVRNLRGNWLDKLVDALLSDAKRMAENLTTHNRLVKTENGNGNQYTSQTILSNSQLEFVGLRSIKHVTIVDKVCDIFQLLPI